MPQSNKPRVSLVVAEDLKERMEEHYPPEGNEYDSLADLVRTSVRRELDGHHEPATVAEQAPSRATAEATEEVVERLTRMEELLEDTNSRIERVESRADTEGPEYDLEKVLFDLLPTARDGEDGTTPAELAEKYGMDAEDVRDALNRLSNRTGQVQAEPLEPDARTVPDDVEAPTVWYRSE
jgi:hypothetical protein